MSSGYFRHGSVNFPPNIVNGRVNLELEKFSPVSRFEPVTSHLKFNVLTIQIVKAFYDIIIM